MSEGERGVTEERVSERGVTMERVCVGVRG